MSDDDHMRRALALATEGLGRTSPNPTVGCVIARDGRVVGEGRTAPPGGPHAEVTALARAGDAARGAVAYTTLEPCNHTGRTGPCSEALIAAGVAEVVFAVADPNPLAAGGAARLRAAGVVVRGGILEAEGRALIRPWLHALTGAPLPWVVAKFACSLDGRTATRTGESKWITGEAARRRGHDLRQRSDAVLVGVGTVLADDPGLDPRPEGAAPAPGLKVVLDTGLRTPVDAKLLRSPGPVLIACAEGADAGRRAALEAAGAMICQAPSGQPLPRERSKSPIWGEGTIGRTALDAAIVPSPGIVDADLSRGRGEGRSTVDLGAVLLALRERGCQSVMIEGGARVLGSAFDMGLVDEVWAFVAPLVIGGGQPAVAGEGPARLADAFRLHDARTEALGPDVLIRGLTAAEETEETQTEDVCSLAS